MTQKPASPNFIRRTPPAYFATATTGYDVEFEGVCVGAVANRPLYREWVAWTSDGKLVPRKFATRREAAQALIEAFRACETLLTA